MFENITEEQILTRMLSRVSSALDKRQSSMIYNSTAPAALELINMYVALDETLNEAFIDTMSLDNLKRKGEELGVTYKEASPTKVKFQADAEVPVGSQFRQGDYTFTITQKLSDFVYYADCDVAGAGSNVCMGDVIMTRNYPNLTSAKIIEISVEGEDDEDVETYRNKLLANSDTETFGGNIGDYKAKVGSIEGVGGVKVYSGTKWNGGGTVKIVFTTSSYNVPSQTLVDQVQTKIDPQVNAGEGIGIAPIGHVVTCLGASAATINITADFTYSDSSYNLEFCLPNMQLAIEEYFLKLNQDWEDRANITVRVADIISYLMDVEGVVDVQNVKLNGSTNNIIVDEDSLVVRGTINGI